MLRVGANCIPPGEGHLRENICGELSLLHLIVLLHLRQKLSVGTKAAASNRFVLFSIKGPNFRCKASVPPGLSSSVPHSRSKLGVPIPKFISRSSILPSISFARRAYHLPGNINLFLYHLLQSFPIGSYNLNRGRTSRSTAHNHIGSLYLLESDSCDYPELRGVSHC
jgi:hypothetical protein